MDASDDDRPASVLAEVLRDQSSGYDRAGLVSLQLLGRPGVRELYPNGITHEEPVLRKLLLTLMPKVELSKEQADLGERVDALTLGIWRGWLTRDLDHVPLPSQRVLAQRLWDAGHRVKGSLFAHAEAIMLEAIATPDQAERALSEAWRMVGLRALLDPALASRLHLSRSQRDEVLFLLKTKEDVMEEFSSVQARFHGFALSRPAIRGDLEQLTLEAKNRQDFVDALIWDVLRPSQARA